ncbi:hypothetical protein [Noviherbaspirillum sp. Root189]|uniref:hypothetical protein n=1 Tax=Noviherbaspirillum sp. Root189 TaxID=1736487 RepID=UPI00070EF11B|nr:hypothetical protein [Noviherbaspirillum sp. Root189]
MSSDLRADCAESEIDEATRAELDQWHTTLAMVRSQQWDSAEQSLQSLLAGDPQSGLYQLCLERVAYY